jgi:hypothetical protein
MKLASNERTEANHKTYPMVSSSDEVEYLKGKITQRSNNIDKWILQRDMYLANLHAIRIVGVLPGTLNLRVGSTVNLLLPSSERQEKGGKLLDSMFTGKYLITALRHKINKAAYACIIEFSKDGIKSKLPEPQDSVTMDDIKGQ